MASSQTLACELGWQVITAVGSGPHLPAGKSTLAGVLKLLGEGVVKAKLPASCMHQGTRLSQVRAWAQPSDIPAAQHSSFVNPQPLKCIQRAAAAQL